MPTPPTRSRGMDKLLGYVADRLPDPEPRNQVSIVLTLDGQPRVFSAAVSDLTNITAREALRAQAGAAYRAALHALECDDPWLPAPADTTGPDAHADDEAGYAAFLDVVRRAYPLHLSRDQILDRLDNEPYHPGRWIDPAPADVTRWIRQALHAGDAVSADDDTVTVPGDGVPYFVRLADDMTAAPAGE